MPPIDDKIARFDEKIGRFEEKVTRLEQIVKDIERIVHGPPPMADKLRDYVDERDDHKEEKAREIAQGIRDAVLEEKRRRDKQHEANEQRLGKLERLAYIGIGMMMLLKLIPSDLLSKVIR